MPKPNEIAEPHKELRFTRTGQALTFVGIAVAFLCLSLALWILATPLLGSAVGERPPLGSHLWGFLPLLPALWSIWVAAHCARHAYVILTPLGIELFPFWVPSKNMQVISWSEITRAEVDDALKVLTIERAGGGKIFVALAPVSKPQRQLLQRAVAGRSP